MGFGPFFVGERRAFVFTVKDRVTQQPVDLSGFTAKVLVRQDGDAANKWTGASEDATIPTPLSGIVNWPMPDPWLLADLGSWSLQLRLLSGSVTQATERLYFRVEDSLLA
jgi:hypothetical protein